MLTKYPYLQTNKLEQDHNGTRIVAACKLMRSTLRVKRGMTEHCREFDVRSFLMEDEWKSVR